MDATICFLNTRTLILPIWFHAIGWECYEACGCPLAALGDALDHCLCPGCTRSQQIHAGSAYLWLLTSRYLGEMQVSPGL